jgi:hypothetical protein
MIIIGLGHYSRTGKDTFANYLLEELEEYGVSAKKISFASKLKDVCHQLYGWAGLREEAYYNDPEFERYRDVVLPIIGMTPVDIWVKFGTPAVRDQVYQNTWIDYVLNTDFGVDVLIIPDVRFPNEVESLRAKGAHLIKVMRPGIKPRLTVADQALYGVEWFDNTIGQSGTLSELKVWAGQYAESIANGDQNLPHPDPII